MLLMFLCPVVCLFISFLFILFSVSLSWNTLCFFSQIINNSRWSHRFFSQSPPCRVSDGATLFPSRVFSNPRIRLSVCPFVHDQKTPHHKYMQRRYIHHGYIHHGHMHQHQGCMHFGYMHHRWSSA